MTETLPAHSHLGASSAERWMGCPGSVTLIQAIQSAPGYEEDDPDYRRDGTQAHALAAHCLEGEIDAWEADADQFPELTADMMDAVQEYLDFVRTQEGERDYELRVHVPEFHPAFFGTLDCVVHSTEVHIIDYKHGVGVVVDAEDNPQLMYYAYGLVNKDHYPPERVVKLTIVQPRAFHPDGTIRTWETTVGHIRQWAEEVLKPAMLATADLDYLALGSWCRFCPAKLVCPAYDGLAKKALQGSLPITYADAQQLKMLVRAVEEDVFKRLMNGEEVDGAKLVKKRANRVFKEAAPLADTFGEDAWEPRKLKSPAEISKLPQGKTFVAEYAFVPDTGFTVASIDDDKRTAVRLKTPEEKYGDPLQYA
jgi:uncharacterized protein DUF2800